MDWVWNHTGIAVALSQAPPPPTSDVAVGGVFYAGMGAVALAAASPTTVAAQPHPPSAAAAASTGTPGAIQAAITTPLAAIAQTSMGSGSVTSAPLPLVGALSGSVSTSASGAGGAPVPGAAATSAAANSGAVEGVVPAPEAHVELTTAVLSVVEIEATMVVPASSASLGAAALGMAFDAVQRPPDVSFVGVLEAVSHVAALAPRQEAVVHSSATALSAVAAAHDPSAAGGNFHPTAGAFVDGILSAPEAALTVRTGVILFDATIEVSSVFLVPQAGASLLPWQGFRTPARGPTARFVEPRSSTQTIFVRLPAPPKGTRFT